MATKKLVRKPSTPSTSSKQVGLNQSQVSQLKGMKGIDQKALSAYEASGSVVGGKNNPNGRGRETPVMTTDKIGVTTPVIPPAPGVQDVGNMLGVNNASVLQDGLTLEGGQFVKDPTASDQMNATKEANAGLGNTANAILSYLKPEQDQAANLYRDTYGVSDKQAGRDFRNAQQEVQQYTSQLNQITASRDAAALSLEGQGRGQTGSFVGGEQARINREAAIQALPVQAQLAAAQGNLEVAKSHVDSLFQMKVKDIETQQAYKQTVANTFMSVANAQQQNLLNAAIADSNARADMKKTAMNDAKSIAMQAIEYGQSSLARNVMSLDTTSPTYQQDVLKAMGQLSKPVAVVTPKAPDLQNFGTATAPLWKQYNPSTGQWDDVQGLSNTPTSNALGNALATQDIYNVNNILNSKGLDSAVGPTGLARTEGGLWSATKRFLGGVLAGGAAGAAAGAPFAGVGAIPGAIIGGLTTGIVRGLQGTKDELTGDRANFIGSVEQMISGLTLDKLAQSKGQGVTFGALSDGERQTIASAASKIGTWRQRADGKADGEVVGYKVNEKDFKKEVDTINYFKQLDAYLQGASAEEVGAQVMPDGTVWVMDSFGNMKQLISTQ